jgi:23S rRNA (uracil1939-C5)-methyltransferase
MEEAGTLELEIESLAYGRAGIARADGKVVFVRGSAPGDKLRATITQDHGSYLEAEIDEIIEAGASRVVPPCPIVDSCGGCPWQHIDYDAQLAAKHRNVVDALQRIGGFKDPPVGAVAPSPKTLGYRNRLKLRFEQGKLGFYSARTHKLVPVSDCLIGEDRVRKALDEVQEFTAGLATRPMRVEIAERGTQSGIVVALNCEGRLRKSDAYRVKAVLGDPNSSIRGVVMWGRGWRREWGNTKRVHRIGAGDATIATRGASFGQVNSGANRALVERVENALAPMAGGRLLDLYAGAGNFTIGLAREAQRVLAIESDGPSVEAGQESATRAGLTNVRFEKRTVEDFLSTAASANYDRVLVNPPRSGLRANAAAIAKIGAPVLVYVSCNPTTLARDLAVLAKQGYALTDAMPVDLFPHTFHVETVCRTELT